MKKYIIIAVIALAIGAILSPVVGMAIGETRSMILGLSPEDSILQLADKIDESRVSTEQSKTETDSKIAELQSTITAQQTKITEQEQMINSQITSVKAETQAVQAKVSNEAECRKLYADNRDCTFKDYRTKSAFNNWMETYKEMDKENNGSTNFYEKNYNEKKPIFDKCQTIIKQCD